MQKPPERFFNPADFVPELQERFKEPPLDPRKLLRVAVAVKNPDEHGGNYVPVESERHLISISDGEQIWDWKVESLRSLFRGDRQPPVLGDYPEAYNDSFILLDLHALEICNIFGDPRDIEMKEVFSLLRRRPDGRSTGFIHDYLWQTAALILGTRPLSQAEFEAILARLERSCRTFAMGPTSRNYAATLRRTLGREDGF